MATVFDKIVAGEVESYVVWQDDRHLGFLTPFPNTPGFTIVIPKANIGDDVFELSEHDYDELMRATRTVAILLKKALSVPRVALIFEGTGIAHVHAKLIPLHGELAGQTDVWSPDTEFNELYRGWIDSKEGPRMSSQRLREIQAQIVKVQVDEVPDRHS